MWKIEPGLIANSLTVPEWIGLAGFAAIFLVALWVIYKFIEAVISE